MDNYILVGGVPYIKATAPNTTNPAYNSGGTHVTTPDPYSTGVNYGSDSLVHKLADEIIPFIRQQSYVRQFFRTIDMPTLQFRVPKINVGSDVWYVGEAAPTPYTPVGTTSVILTAKKLMTALTLSSELTEDNIVPILPHIKRDLAKAFALAEEELFLYGNEDPGTAISGSLFWGNIVTAATNVAPTLPRAVDKVNSSVATEGGWFQNDKRLAFDGISVLTEPGFTSPNSPGAPPAVVDAGARPLSIDDINEGIERLDVFGRDKSQLLLITSLREEKTLRGDPTILTTLERFGPNAVFLTGEIGKVYGVSCVATNLIPKNIGTVYIASGSTSTANVADSSATNPIGVKSEAFLINRNALLIGDRRYFTLKASDIPFMMADQLLLVATERIALASQYRKAMVKLQNITP